MKYLSLILTFVFASSLLVGQSDGIDNFFDKYKEDDQFTTIYLSPKMFEIASKMTPDELDSDVKEMIANSKGLRVLMTKVTPLDYYKEAYNVIKTGQYESLLAVKSDDENVRILVKDDESGDVIKELVILVGAEEFVLVSFSGELNLETISKMIQDMDKLDFNKAEDVSNMDDMEAQLKEISSAEFQDINKEIGLNIPTNDNLGIKEIKVYPNPNIGMFTLNFNLPQQGNTLVKLFSGSGQMIYSKDLGNYKGSFSEDLDIVTEGPGIYFLLIQQDGESFSRKIIVSRN